MEKSQPLAFSLPSSESTILRTLGGEFLSRNGGRDWLFYPVDHWPLTFPSLLVSKVSLPMKKEEILAKLQSGELSIEAASKLLAEVETPKRGQLYCKVSEKGGLSVYGLQRMPVTLYMEQWDRLLSYADDIRNFIKDNEGKLKKKDAKEM